MCLLDASSRFSGSVLAAWLSSHTNRRGKTRLVPMIPDTFRNTLVARCSAEDRIGCAATAPHEPMRSQSAAADSEMLIMRRSST